MKPVYKGLTLGVIQLALVASLGGKMLYDRATRPRVCVRTAPVDPNLPIRGCYVALRLEVPARGIAAPVNRWTELKISLLLEDRRLVAVPVAPSRAWAEGFYAQVRTVDGAEMADLRGPVAFFILEHALDPSRREPGEELWVEVTLPKRGPPRPIRLGVKKGGTLTPLELR